MDQGTFGIEGVVVNDQELSPELVAWIYGTPLIWNV